MAKRSLDPRLASDVVRRLEHAAIQSLSWMSTCALQRDSWLRTIGRQTLRKLVEMAIVQVSSLILSHVEED